ncbi:unnamed protein product [Symbiodinium sp. CCMP2456]|nr:unnamed protein product [Symbiodinium sp. CCMP2456]
MSAVADDDNQQEIHQGEWNQEIGALIGAAQGIKIAHGLHGCTYDVWEVNVPQLKFAGHVKTVRGHARSSYRSLQDFASTDVPID